MWTRNILKYENIAATLGAIEACLLSFSSQKLRTNGHVTILLLLWSAAFYLQLQLWLIVLRKFTVYLPAGG